MGIMSIFGTRKESQNVPSVQINEELPKENDSRKANDIITIQYGTGYPIDVIYANVGKDLSEKGYGDAMVNPDAAYMKMGIDLIKSNMKKLFIQVSTRYNDEIKVIDMAIKKNEEFGLLDTAQELITRKEIYIRHLAEISSMKEKLEAGDEEMKVSIATYEQGFKRGVAAKTMQLLDSINPIIENCHE